MIALRSLPACGMLALLAAPSLANAQSPVSFDTDSVFPCRVVAAPENGDTGRKFVVIAVPVSANFQEDEATVETIRYEFRLPPSMKVRDHLPKTQTEAMVLAYLERKVVDNRRDVRVEYGVGGRVGFSLLGAGVELGGEAKKETNDRSQVKTDIQVDRLPPLEQVIVAGTMNARQTLYFDMKWHTRATRAGSKDYAILAEVDKDWTDDALTLVATALRNGKEVARYNQGVGLYVSGDRKAEQRALAKARSNAGGSQAEINSVGMMMQLVPSGTFLRGSAELKARDIFDQMKRDLILEVEGPQREITISQSFRIGAHEVTQGQYKAVMGTNPSSFTGGDDLPVENVSWMDAVTFCNRLSEKEKRTPFYGIVGQSVRVLGGNGYHLPTEAQWEYACRGGSRARWPFGDDGGIMGKFEWIRQNSEGKTHPVGGKAPNGFGLHDMLGNVCEWCQDGYDSKYYKNSPNVDPQGPEDFELRIKHGGDLASPADYPPSFSTRDRAKPSYVDRSLGFRVVRVP
jgi:formylglycine-generating enzyme required for sulfatase activity